MRSLHAHLHRHRVWLGGLVAATALTACGLEDEAGEPEATEEMTEEDMGDDMTEEEMTEDMDDEG